MTPALDQRGSLKPARRVYTGGIIYAAICLGTEYHVITSKTYYIHDFRTGEVIRSIDFTFIENYELPKKLPKVSVKSIDNQYGLGDVSSANFYVG